MVTVVGILMSGWERICGRDFKLKFLVVKEWIDFFKIDPVVLCIYCVSIFQNFIFAVNKIFTGVKVSNTMNWFVFFYRYSIMALSNVVTAMQMSLNLAFFKWESFYYTIWVVYNKLIFLYFIFSLNLNHKLFLTLTNIHNQGDFNTYNNLANLTLTFFLNFFLFKNLIFHFYFTHHFHIKFLYFVLNQCEDKKYSTHPLYHRALFDLILLV